MAAVLPRYGTAYRVIGLYSQAWGSNEAETYHPLR
jgi:hypothetical protein